jgi:uncharacterized MAPEG superfamily protein
MTTDQKNVAIGAASGIVAMILSLWMFFNLLPEPGAFDAGARIAYALKWDAVAALPLFLMLAAIGNARFASEAIDPTLGKESATMKVDARVASNTLEQFVIFLAATLALAASADGEAVKIVGAAAITFVIMRVAFWVGYRIKPVYRAFGFASTAYMNLGLLIAAIWFGFA